MCTVLSVDDTLGNSPYVSTFLTFSPPTNTPMRHVPDQQWDAGILTTVRRCPLTIGDIPGVTLSLPDHYILYIRKSGVTQVRLSYER